MPSYPWVAMGYKDPDDIRRPLNLLERKGKGNYTLAKQGCS
ncbi:MAG: hypothetical protein ACO2O5_01115 [Candidatus Caldipriscus sp.]